MLPTTKVAGFPPQRGFGPRFVCGRRLSGTTAVQPEGRSPSLRRTPIPSGICGWTRVLSPRGGTISPFRVEMGRHSRFNSRCPRALSLKRERELNPVRGHRSRVSTDRRDGGRSGRSVRGRITAARIGEDLCPTNTDYIEALHGVKRFVRHETAAGRHTDTSGCGRLRAPLTSLLVGFRAWRQIV